MTDSLHNIGASFDARAERYNFNEWHRACAERLVEFSRLSCGDVVLDAGTGTGLAAISAAQAVGLHGRVVAVDLSVGMLGVARQQVLDPVSGPIEWVHGNAIALPDCSAGTFDAILCCAALLYMPVQTALAEWRRMLKRGGTVAFSSMRTGSPTAGRLFRECAALCGFHLLDPSEGLGSEEACHAALQDAGFLDTEVMSHRLPFTAQDAEMAWESNLGSAAHRVVREASPEIIARIKESFARSLTETEARMPGTTLSAEVLFAKGVR
jgi:ubiquinone/menaquinone biosynthesis C-methylase UbiE